MESSNVKELENVNVNQDQCLEMYKMMLRIRYFEEKLNWLFSKGKLGGTTHLSIGQEAVAVGICHYLTHDDYAISSHRGHGHLIAKGGDLYKMFCELMGKSDGYCMGKGGSQHMADKEIGFYGTNGITAGGIPLATGLALSAKLRINERISVSFFGDGATNQGTFYESINMASIWDLPIIYVCENNLYGMSTHIKDVSATEDLIKKAQAHNIESRIIDGVNLIEILKEVKSIVEYVRRDKKPFFLEARTYRFCGHSKSDARKYRTKEEEEYWKSKDCILQFSNYLKNLGFSEEEIKLMDQEVQLEVDKAADKSDECKFTPSHLAFEGVFKDG